MRPPCAILLRGDVHPDAHAARAGIDDGAALDAVRDAPLAQPHAVFARVRDGASAHCDPVRAVRQHSRARVRRRLSARPLARTERRIVADLSAGQSLTAFETLAARGVGKREGDVLENDVMDERFLFRIARDAQDRDESRHRILEARRLQRLARTRNVHDLLRLAVVQPLARLVERKRRVLDVVRGIRVPRVPLRHGPSFREHHAPCGVVAADRTTRGRPLVVDDEMRKTQMGEAAIRERREIVAVREKLHQFGVAREKRGLRAFRLQKSLVGITGSLRAASVHVQLLEPDGNLKTGLLLDRDVRLPTSVGTDAPAFELVRADDAGRAVGGAAPRDGRARRAGVFGEKGQRLVDGVLARGERNCPRSAIRRFLPQRAQRFLRLTGRRERMRCGTIAHGVAVWCNEDRVICGIDRAARKRDGHCTQD